MLYRRVHRDTAAQNITNDVAWSIVNSREEETRAIYNGWVSSISLAQRQQVRHQTLLAPWRFCLSHWRWFWGIVLGAAVTQVIKSFMSK